MLYWTIFSTRGFEASCPTTSNLCSRLPR